MTRCADYEGLLRLGVAFRHSSELSEALLFVRRFRTISLQP